MDSLIGEQNFKLDLSYKPDPLTISTKSTLTKFNKQLNALKIVGVYNATWVFDLKHRKSMDGIIVMLVGAAVYYYTYL